MPFVWRHLRFFRFSISMHPSRLEKSLEILEMPLFHSTHPISMWRHFVRRSFVRYSWGSRGRKCKNMRMFSVGDSSAWEVVPFLPWWWRWRWWWRWWSWFAILAPMMVVVIFMMVAILPKRNLLSLSLRLLGFRAWEWLLTVFPLDDLD